MKVREIMSARVCIVYATDSLACAARLMWEYDIGFLPVLGDRANVIGTVTDRDILMAAYTRGIRLTEANVGSAMSAHLYTIAPTASLTELDSLMWACRVRRAPVVDEIGRLLGVVTLGDLSSYTVEHVVGGVLSPLSLVKTLARVSGGGIGSHRRLESAE